MKQHQIIENIIPSSYQNFIENLCDNKDFPYFWTPKISYNPNDTKFNNPLIKNPPGWTHNVFDIDKGENSLAFPHIRPVLFFLEEKTGVKVDVIKRIRIRRTTNQIDYKPENFTPPHVDLGSIEPYWSLVYYVDDSDGDTILFDKEYKEGDPDNLFEETSHKELLRSKPIKGNGLLFKGKTYHSGNCPCFSNKRTVINFDFTVK
jgi:hypothetical protein